MGALASSFIIVPVQVPLHPKDPSAAFYSNVPFQLFFDTRTAGDPSLLSVSYASRPSSVRLCSWDP